MSVKFDNMLVVIDCIKEVDLEQTKKYIKSIKRENINNASKTGLSIIHYACLEGDTEIVKLLLEHRANPSLEDSEGWTPLHISVSTNNVQLTNLLLKYGADPSITNLDGETPLDIAENEEIIESLNCSIDSEQSSSNSTSQEKELLHALQTAHRENKFKALQESLNISEDGRLLHLAAAYGFTKIADYICKHKLENVNERDEDGWTPLHVASYWKQEQIVTILKKYGADKNIKTKLYTKPSEL